MMADTVEESEMIDVQSDDNHQHKANENDANLPSINEELARIFPDSADVFLNESVKRGRGRPRKCPVKQKVAVHVPGRGRGRPRIHPIIKKEKIPGRGRGRPRKNPAVVPSSEKKVLGRGRPRKNAANSSKSEKKDSGRSRGRPRVYPVLPSTERRVVEKEKVKKGRGRPRIYPMKTSSNSPGVRKVGRPKQKPEDHEAKGGKKIKRNMEPAFNDLDLNLRKKPRLSYVDDDIDMIDDDDDYSDIVQFNIKSTNNMNDRDSESGFESGESPVVVKRGRGRPRKNQVIVSRRGRPKNYEHLSLNMTRSLCVSLERLDSQTLSKVNSTISHLPVIKRKKGRPRKNSYPSCGRPRKYPVASNTKVNIPSGRKRGRPKGSKKKHENQASSSVEEKFTIAVELPDLSENVNVTNEVTNVPRDDVEPVMVDTVKETVAGVSDVVVTKSEAPDEVVTNATASEIFIDLTID